jgi:hypothetical protein
MIAVKVTTALLASILKHCSLIAGIDRGLGGETYHSNLLLLVRYGR